MQNTLLGAVQLFDDTEIHVEWSPVSRTFRVAFGDRNRPAATLYLTAHASAVLSASIDVALADRQAVAG